MRGEPVAGAAGGAARPLRVPHGGADRADRGTEFPAIGELPYSSPCRPTASTGSPCRRPIGRGRPAAGAAGAVHDGPHRGIESLMAGRERVAFERTVVPPFLMSRRWFGAKGSRIKGVKVVDCAAFGPREGGEPRYLLPRLAVSLSNGETHEYFVPVGVDEGREDVDLMEFAVARVRRGPRTGLLFGRRAPTTSPPASSRTCASTGRSRPSAAARLRHHLGLRSGRERGRRRHPPPQGRAEQHLDRGGLEADAQAPAPAPAGHPSRDRGRRFLTEVAGFPHTPALLAPWNTSPRTAPAPRSPCCRSSSSTRATRGP